MDDTSVSVSDTTLKLASLLSRCCVDLQVQPSDLRYGRFKRWLKETWQLTDEDMREVSEHIALVGGYSAIRDAFFASASSVHSIERAELKSVARLGKVATTALANEDLFLAKLEKRLSAALEKHAHYKPFGYATRQKALGKSRSAGRVVTLVLSDLHFGTSLDPREVPYRYGFVEEARRLASVIKRVCAFKRDYRGETELVVLLLGDIIAGLIHDSRSVLTLAEQYADAVWLLRQALIVLAGEYKKVTVYCSSGNHDRNPLRHSDRAVAGKWDSYATKIYFAVKMSVTHLPNVKVVIPRTPHVEYSPFPGQRVYATHGDTCLNPGNPGHSINVSSLETQMLRINDGEIALSKQPFGLFICGHVHVGSLSHPATADLLTNGCLIPPDPYAVSIGRKSSKNGQYMFETVQSRLVGDSRFLGVNTEVDQDASLDEVITPWSGEF